MTLEQPPAHGMRECEIRSLPTLVCVALMAIAARVGQSPSVNKTGAGMNFIDPDDIRDTFLCGCCLIEKISHGMIRMWCYSEEQGEQIIRAKLVLPLSRAFEINAQVRRELALLTPLKIVKN